MALFEGGWDSGAAAGLVMVEGPGGEGEGEGTGTGTGATDMGVGGREEAMAGVGGKAGMEEGMAVVMVVGLAEVLVEARAEGWEGGWVGDPAAVVMAAGLEKDSGVGWVGAKGEGKGEAKGEDLEEVKEAG